MTQPGLWHSPKSDPFSSVDPRSSTSARQKSNLFDCLGPFLPAQKNIKKLCLPKFTKISKNHTLVTQCFNFGVFLVPFGSPCSINFPARLNLLICKTYNAKASFLHHFRPPILASKNMFFQTPVLGPFFLYFCLFFF